LIDSFIIDFICRILFYISYQFYFKIDLKNIYYDEIKKQRQQQINYTNL